MGPTLLGRVLELNDTQEGVLEIAFKLADDQGLLLLDLDDLRALLNHVGENARRDLDRLRPHEHDVGLRRFSARCSRSRTTAARPSSASRRSTSPISCAPISSGRGVVNILAADQLDPASRALYSTFLLWLLSELFEHLPEVGDLEKPKLVFFFDEAHLLFDDAPAALHQTRSSRSCA